MCYATLLHNQLKPSARRFAPRHRTLLSSKTNAVSFYHFDLSKERLPPTSFFYAVEETYHSAKYIIKNEKIDVKRWSDHVIQKIER